MDSLLKRWWDEEEESDDDDLFVVGAVLTGLKRKQSEKKFRGSLPGRHNVQRGIQGGHQRLYLDYFAPQPVYNNKHFRRRFRMSKSLFLRIAAALDAHDEYFR